jgi:hypothetical protein
MMVLCGVTWSSMPMICHGVRNGAASLLCTDRHVAETERERERERESSVAVFRLLAAHAHV